MFFQQRKGYLRERAVTGLRQDVAYPPVHREAVEALGVEAEVLRERIWQGSIPHEIDEHGRVYAPPSAYTNLPESDHSRHRKPQDKAMIRDLEAQAANLSAALGPPQNLESPPVAPEAPKEYI